MKTKCLASVFASVLMAVQVLGQSPSIKFTFVPQLDDTDVAICTVTNVDRTVYGVCFILDFQNTKWTKPNSQYPISLIGSNNTAGVLLAWWNGADTYADKIYAFVVPLVYSNSIPFLAGQGSIPLEIYSNSIAYAVAERGSTNDYIGISGMVWQKKETGPFTWGPGPNYFSGNSNNVFVDGNGRLHLRITNRNGTWYCPEIMLTNSLGYGIYRFHVDSDVSTMSTQVVLGTFTYSDDTDYAHREIDVESSGGPVVGNGTINTWQHVVQPWSYGGHRFQFAPPANMNKSVHQFLWMEDRVLFNSFTN